MGNDIPDMEKEFRYKELYNGIYSIENYILYELGNPDIKSKSYRTYGLINKDLCKKYPYLIKEYFNYNLTLNYNFDNKDIPHLNDEKNFSYINKDFSFTFPTNFILINEDFMDIIRDYAKEIEIKKKLVSKYDIIIGGGCLIMKNPGYYESKNQFRYIILYRDIKEEEGNDIDFFLYINS